MIVVNVFVMREASESVFHCESGYSYIAWAQASSSQTHIYIAQVCQFSHFAKVIQKSCSHIVYNFIIKLLLNI